MRIEEGRGSRLHEMGDGGRGDTSINIECLPLVEHPVLLLILNRLTTVNDVQQLRILGAEPLKCCKKS